MAWTGGTPFLAVEQWRELGPAVLKGNRLFVKVCCPRKVGRACRIAAQGFLRKGKPAKAT